MSNEHQHRRPGPVVTGLLVGGLLFAAGAVGCGDGSGDGGAGSQTAPFVMRPSLPELEEVRASVRSQIAFAKGLDLYPEYARVGRCSLTGQGVIAQLQYSASPPGNPAFQLTYRDPGSGEEFRSPEPRGPMPRLDWDGDTESGRATFSLEMALPVTVRDPQRELGPGDCLLTIFTFSGAPAP